MMKPIVMEIPYPVAFFGGSPGLGELLIIFVVALLLFGSKNLPKIARGLGRAMEEFRRAARQVTDEITKADREPPSTPSSAPKESPEKEPVKNERTTPP